MLYLVLRTLAGVLEGFSLYKSDKKCRKINVMSRHGETCLLFYFAQPAAGLWVKHRGEDLFLAQGSRERYSHIKMTVTLCVHLFIQMRIMHFSHGWWFYGSMILHRIAVASIASLITGTQYRAAQNIKAWTIITLGSKENSYYICIAVNNCFKLCINAHCTGKTYTMNETYPSIEHLWIFAFFVLFYSFQSCLVLLYFVLL